MAIVPPPHPHTDNGLVPRLRELLCQGLTSSDMNTAVRCHIGHDLDTICAAMTPTGDPIDLDERLLCVGEPDWPGRFHGLAELGGPWWLWVHGQREHLNSPVSVAIVGTRRATADGLQIARSMAADLAACGVTIVSGMANGIDQAAHQGCLDAGGATIGVLGCGLDIDYPKHTWGLKRRIMDQGCLVSEQPPRLPIRYPSQFLERNRIIAALADVVVIIEAKARSGALNTAGWAGEYNRECVVIPASPNHPGAAGSLKLIRDGCQMVRHGDDVLEVLGIDPHVMKIQRAPGVAESLRGDRLRVYQLLSPHPTPIATIVDHARLPFPRAMEVVGELVTLNLAEITGEGISFAV